MASLERMRHVAPASEGLFLLSSAAQAGCPCAPLGVDLRGRVPRPARHGRAVNQRQLTSAAGRADSLATGGGRSHTLGSSTVFADCESNHGAPRPPFIHRRHVRQLPCPSAPADAVVGPVQDDN